MGSGLPRYFGVRTYGHPPPFAPPLRPPTLPPMNKKALGCLFIVLTLALVLSVACNFFQFLALLGLGVDEKEHFSEVTEQEGSGGAKDKIVRIDLEGVIAGASGGGIL